jgi:hypothetical protein
MDRSPAAGSPWGTVAAGRTDDAGLAHVFRGGDAEFVGGADPSTANRDAREVMTRHERLTISNKICAGALTLDRVLLVADLDEVADSRKLIQDITSEKLACSGDRTDV